ncbi:MAG: MurR/RpiR family transcriptional regulator [Xylanivirga thermophila]|jgi:DNA-binding MurR/RpiR family transcriptional regulator|uniref:MurR/RpiR family transcriptional regulator n=1 Tax=Xylanivirga thermophila TaxID=2496273 RepID=UPI0039F56C29
MDYEIGTLFPLLSTLKHSFTKSEKKVMDAFLENPEEVLYSSITDFSEKAKVGDTTVVRFCRKLGFKGYHDFKIAVAQELSNSSSNTFGSFNEGIDIKDSFDDVLQKLIGKNIEALQETATLLNKADVEKAVKFIEDSRMTVFYGVGTSGITALDAKNKFMRIGIPVDAYTDGHMQAMSASLLTEVDTAIAISYSGSTKDTVDTMQIARENGAKTICITHYAKSPVTKYADVVLLSGYNESPLQGGALITKIAQLYVIDVLYTEYFRKNVSMASKNKSRSGSAISDKLY